MNTDIILQNIMDACGIDQDRAREELESELNAAADNYLCETIIDGESDSRAFFAAVDMVTGDLAIEQDYAVSVAEMLTAYVAEHPELEERAKRIRAQKDEEEREEEEAREHISRGEVYALVRAENRDGVPYPAGRTIEESAAWVMQGECVMMGGGLLIPWVTRSELDRLGIWYARPEAVATEDDEWLA